MITLYMPCILFDIDIVYNCYVWIRLVKIARMD